VRLPSRPRISFLIAAFGFLFSPPVSFSAPSLSHPVQALVPPPLPGRLPPPGERDFVDPRRFLFIDGVLLLYYVILAKALSSTRETAPLVIEYAPPANLSPAQLRYLLTGDSDSKTVASVVLHLAARGLVTIKCLDNFYLIARHADRLPPNLPPEEAAAFCVMFGLAPASELPPPNPFLDPAVPEGSFLLHPIQGSQFGAVLHAIHKSLHAGYDRRFFNRFHALSIPAAILSIFLLVDTAMTFPRSLFQTSLILIGIFLATLSPYVREAFRGRNPPNRQAGIIAIIILYLTYIGMSTGLTHQYPNTFLFSLLAAVAANVYFPQTFRKPTREGISLQHQLAGYREFLNRVEVDRMQRVIGGNWTPSQTTVNLSYSIAFDLHGAWEDYLAQSDFHSVYWGPSKTKPPLPGFRPASPDSTGWPFVVRYLVLPLILVPGVIIAIKIATTEIEFFLILGFTVLLGRLADYAFRLSREKP
jgi:hypothetical protein